MHGATVFSVMLGASKYARSNRLLCHARSSVVCTEQPFTQAFSARSNRFSLPCSEHRSMHGSTVYSDRKMHGATAVFSVMLGASKCAQNSRLISHARSIEACTEQPFNQSCSELRSMHGATVFPMMIFGQHSFPLTLFSISALMPFYVIPSMLGSMHCPCMSEHFVVFDTEHA